jgi:hypothetical protein
MGQLWSDPTKGSVSGDASATQGIFEPWEMTEQKKRRDKLIESYRRAGQPVPPYLLVPTFPIMTMKPVRPLLFFITRFDVDLN